MGAGVRVFDDPTEEGGAASAPGFSPCCLSLSHQVGSRKSWVRGERTNEEGAKFTSAVPLNPHVEASGAPRPFVPGNKTGPQPSPPGPFGPLSAGSLVPEGPRNHTSITNTRTSY